MFKQPGPSVFPSIFMLQVDAVYTTGTESLFLFSCQIIIIHVLIMACFRLGFFVCLLFQSFPLFSRLNLDQIQVKELQ